MFFSVYCGEASGVAEWRAAVRQHARWLALTPHLESRPLGDATCLAVAWLEREPAELGRRLQEDGKRVISTALPGGWIGPLLASTARREIQITTPPATPQQVYVAMTSHGYVLADDARLFPRLLDLELDDHAIYALLQYGTIPPPLTIWRGVHRLPNGHVCTVRPDARELACTPCFEASEPTATPDGGTAATDRVRRTLDTLLARVPPSAALYFSGGVDSGLLAARLARNDRKDVLLVHYTFGPDDRESALALRMAHRLGLQCHQVRHAPDQIAQVLDRLGGEYSFPFGDLSTLPTNILVHASLASLSPGSAVIEGTGADGAFGLTADYLRWRRVYRLPGFLRRRLHNAYAELGLWQRRSRVERWGRALRRSARMPLEHALVAQNALDGIAYAIPDRSRAVLSRAVSTYIEIFGAETTPEEQLSLMDLIWVCAGRMAPKSFDPLRHRGIRPYYPFLGTTMLQVSTSLSRDDKYAGGGTKAVLKRLLAEELPREWVYRPKSPFAPPYHEIFASSAMQEFLHDVVLSPGNPLLDFCRPDVLRRLIDGARNRRPLGGGAFDFLWVLTFTSGWLRQLPHETSSPRAAAACAEYDGATG